LAGVVVGQAAQGYCIHHGEYSGVAADPECQGDGGDCGEARVAPEKPARVPQIALPPRQSCAAERFQLGRDARFGCVNLPREFRLVCDLLLGAAQRVGLGSHAREGFGVSLVQLQGEFRYDFALPLGRDMQARQAATHVRTPIRHG
jgi:hypothetical protein